MVLCLPRSINVGTACIRLILLAGMSPSQMIVALTAPGAISTILLIQCAAFKPSPNSRVGSPISQINISKSYGEDTSAKIAE